METKICSDGLVHFRGFRFDLETHELSRKGCEIAIRGHPAQVLALLLEHPGKVVSRAAFRQSLWPDHTFVDFEHILNNSINRLREVLGDDANSPRFIQTVPGLGYRFIAHLECPRRRKLTPPPAPATGSGLGIKLRDSVQIYESNAHKRRFERWTSPNGWVDRFFAVTKAMFPPFRREPKSSRIRKETSTN